MGLPCLLSGVLNKVGQLYLTCEQDLYSVLLVVPSGKCQTLLINFPFCFEGFDKIKNLYGCVAVHAKLFFRCPWDFCRKHSGNSFVFLKGKENVIRVL